MIYILAIILGGANGLFFFFFLSKSELVFGGVAKICSDDQNFPFKLSNSRKSRGRKPVFDFQTRLQFFTDWVVIIKFEI